MLFPLEAAQRDIIPDPFQNILLGTGEEAFISSGAHWPNLLATNMYKIVWGCVAPKKPDDAVWFAGNARLQKSRVSTDLRELLKRVMDDGQGIPVLSVCTPTPLHADQICLALEMGIKYIISDKPIVTCSAEYQQIMRAMEGKQARIYITFNHRFNGPMFMMREIAASNPGAVYRIDAGFLQDWLLREVSFQQADWRVAHRLCGLLDIGSHGADGASFVAGEPIDAVSNGTVQSVGPFAKERRFSDHGTCDLSFANGIIGSVTYHQSLVGHADDFYVMMTMTDGTKSLFRMEWGSETLFTTRSGTLGSRVGWDDHLRGYSQMFSSQVNDAFGSTPGGHIQGWPSYWRYLLLAIAGDILRQEKHPICEENGKYLPSVMKLPVPTIDDAGKSITAYVDAHDLSAKENGREVKLSEVLAV